MLISHHTPNVSQRLASHRPDPRPSEEEPTTLYDRFEATAAYTWHSGSLGALTGTLTYMLTDNPVAGTLAAVGGAGLGATLTYLNRKGLF